MIEIKNWFNYISFDKLILMKMIIKFIWLIYSKSKVFFIQQVYIIWDIFF